MNGLTANQWHTLTRSEQELLRAWLTKVGVEESECAAIRFDPDGTAHFEIIDIEDRQIVGRHWLAVPQPPQPPDIHWWPWKEESA